jgi:hypothetical protein
MSQESQSPDNQPGASRGSTDRPPDASPPRADPPPAKVLPIDYASPAPRPDRRSILMLLVTVFVVVFIVLFGVAILLGNLGGPRHPANRLKCASNLRQIGQGLLLYANDWGCFPRTCYDPTKPPTSFTPPARKGGMAPNERDPFSGPNRPADNDVTAALFLLVRAVDVSPDVFVCPTTEHEKDTLNSVPPGNRVNFNSAQNLSYSYANPYPSQRAINLGYRLGPNAIATFAIAADRNDGDLNGNLNADSRSTVKVQRKMNSRNHDGDGQNVLFNDGHVEWAMTPWCGDQNDCIWGDAVVSASATQPSQRSPAKTGNGVDPRLPLDSILLPRKGMGLP